MVGHKHIYRKKAGHAGLYCYCGKHIKVKDA